MKPLTPQKTIHRYYLQCLPVILLYIIVVITLMSVFRNFLSAILCALLYMPVKFLIRMIANKVIVSVLFEELDPQKFQEILNDRHLLPPIGYRMSAALCLGDYQTVVTICVHQLHKKDSVRNKCLYLGILAQVYFELRDFEKLEALCKKYQEYRNLYPKKSIFQTTRAVWSYYESYLSNRYEECESICKEQALKSKKNKFMKLQNDFYYAVAYYENGEFAAAKERFHNVVIGAPKMNYARIAQKYIEAIEAQAKIVLFEQSVLPDEKDAVFHDAASSRIRRHKLIIRIAMWAGIALIVASLLFDYFIHRV